MSALLLACAVVAASPIGIVRTVAHDDARDRPVAFDVWYPTTSTAPATTIRDVPVYVAHDAVVDAPVDGRGLGIALLSHGHGGTPTDLAWLVRPLVESGFVVVAVRHPGNTWGDMDGRRSLMIWERPRDLSFVLDRVLASETFAPHVDPARVVALGHSLGGYTVLAAAGARYDYLRARRHCASAARDPACDHVPDVDRATIDYTAAGLSHKDPRIRAVVAFAPAVGPGFVDESARDVDVPVLIVAARDDALTLPPVHAARWAHALAADFLVVPEGGHAVFIGPCHLTARALAPFAFRACVTSGQADREAVHARLAPTVTGFVRGVVPAPVARVDDDEAAPAR